MTPFVYADEWVYARASDLQIEDFTCWRRTPTGRRRRPFLHMKAGAYEVVLDGYKPMWAFLDALLDRPPRRPFNDLMSGNIENADFVSELKWFLANCEKTLCFWGIYDEHLEVANSKKTVGAHLVSQVINAGCSDVFGLTSSFAHILTPSRTSEGVSWIETDVLGADPQLVFARADGMLITFVSEASGRPNYRPYRRTAFPHPPDIRPAAEQMHHMMSEQDFKRAISHRNKPAGMFDNEIDDYEWRIFCNGRK